MSAAARTVRRDDDGVNYLASVSDLMSGLLFLFIIVLVVFALSLRIREDAKRKEIERLTGAGQDRIVLLQTIKEKLEIAGVRVEVDEKQGVLRLGEGILFGSGEDKPYATGEETLRKLALILRDILPCYTDGVTSGERTACGDRGARGRIDALLVEGHTDDEPIRNSKFDDNWDLSATRARVVFSRVLESAPQVGSLRNRYGQPLLSISGYADTRPVQANVDADSRRRNRRIDLRFIMVPPEEALVEPARETSERLTP